MAKDLIAITVELWAEEGEVTEKVAGALMESACKIAEMGSISPGHWHLITGERGEDGVIDIYV